MKLTILLIQLLFCLAAKYRTLLPSDDLEDMSVSNSSQAGLTSHQIRAISGP